MIRLAVRFGKHRLNASLRRFSFVDRGAPAGSQDESDLRPVPPDVTGEIPAIHPWARYQPFKHAVMRVKSASGLVCPQSVEMRAPGENFGFGAGLPDFELGLGLRLRL